MSSSEVIDRPATTPGRPDPRLGRAALRKARTHERRAGSLLWRYLGYVGYFVGAGLISGAVVHHPLDPARYTRIAAYGVLVFLAATVLNEVVLTRTKPALPGMLMLIGSSLMLSFGIGMLSGGLQHFDDFPARGAVLVPLGITVSFIAYVLKDPDTTWRRIFSTVGLAVLLTAIVSFVGLRSVADSMGEQPPGGHSHSGGGATESDEHDESAPPANGTPQPDATNSSSRSPQASEPAHQDGHDH